MKYPLWILNSSLLILMILVLCIMYFSRVTIPETQEINPTVYSKVNGSKKLEINTQQIYEADLFGTYKPMTTDFEIKDELAIPEPPAPHIVEVPTLPKPQFLDPLNITLKGIFTINTDSSKNRAIIMDNPTLQEVSYKVGDKIGDSQLIRIFSNKVVLLRLNGQQEVLYVRETDAQLDPSYATPDQWTSIISAMNASTFIVDPSLFTQNVSDLAQLIDMLHLITAYKQGKSIGCRVGNLDEKSLGIALGLHAGDIITSINSLAVDTTEHRLQAYKSVISKQANDSVDVQLMRNKEIYTLSYILKDFIPEAIQSVAPENPFSLQKIEEAEKMRIMKEQYEFAPTIETIRARERENMKRNGVEPSSPTEPKEAAQ